MNSFKNLIYFYSKLNKKNVEYIQMFFPDNKII